MPRFQRRKTKRGPQMLPGFSKCHVIQAVQMLDPSAQFGMLNITSVPEGTLYADHSYFNRGWEKGMFRLVRGAIHLTRICPGKHDRLKTLGVEIQPWRENGNHIVVIVPGSYIAGWLHIEHAVHDMVAEVKRYTDRPILMQPKGYRLSDALKGAWAAICPVSVGGVEAAIAGVPVFSTALCPTWPINPGPLCDIEKPALHDRYEWAQSLANASWRCDEIHMIDLESYQR